MSWGRRPKDSGNVFGRGGEVVGSLEIDHRFRSFSVLACMLRQANNLPPNQHLLIYFFTPLSILSQECREWGPCTLGELKNWARHNITFIVPQRAAVCSRQSSVSNCLCYQFVWSTLVLCSFLGKFSNAGGDRQIADSWEISITVCRYLWSERAHGSRYDNKQSSICLTLLISGRWYQPVGD